MWLLVRTACHTWTSCCVHAVVVVGSPYSELYVDWMPHCWNISWSKLVLAAWSRRIERALWQRLNCVLELRTKWTDKVIAAKVCHAKSSKRIGVVRALPCHSCADVSEGEAKALPCQSCADVSEGEAKALPCQSWADVSEGEAKAFLCQSCALSSKQARRPRLRLAVY